MTLLAFSFFLSEIVCRSASDSRSDIKASAVKWKLFNFPNQPDYDKMFKIPVDITDITNIDYVSIKSSTGNYGQSVAERAIDGDSKTHWETRNSISEGNPSDLTLIFENKVAKFTRVVYQTRTDGAGPKGFPLEYEIYGTGLNDIETLQLICSGTFDTTDVTNKMLDITIPETTFKIFRFRFITANANMPSCATLAFYTDDPVDDFSDRLFTDGTWSQLAITKAEAQNFLKSVEKHPMKVNYAEKIEALEDVVADIGKGYLLNRVYEIENRSPGKTSEMQLGQNFPPYIPLGLYVQSKENIKVYADIPKGTSSVINFVKFLDKNDDFILNKDLVHGFNRVQAKDYSSNNSRSMVALVDASSAGTSTEPGKTLPKLRIKGAMNCPLFDKTRGDNLKQFEEELIYYLDNVLNDNSYFNQSKIITDKFYDVAIARYKDVAVVTTAHGLLDNIKKNREYGDTLYDALNTWQEIADGYMEYLGFDDNDPLACHKRRKGMMYCLMIAQDGKPFAWSDGSFTGYNNNNYNGTGIVQGGWIQSVLVNYNLKNTGWGYYHEWGHSHDNGKIKVSETTNNFFSLYYQRKFENKYDRLSSDNVYGTIYSPSGLGKTIGVFEKLALMRKVEILSEIGKPNEWFYPHFQRWIREDNFKNGLVPLNSDECWFYAASQFMKINFLPLITRYNTTYDKSIQDELNTYKQIKTAALYTDERFWIARHTKNGTSARIDKNMKAFIKQVYINNVNLAISIGLNENSQKNEFDDIIGYEYKDATTKQLIKMVTTGGINLPLSKRDGYDWASDEINYIMTPITMKLERLRPFKLTGRFVYIQNSNHKDWSIEPYPYNVPINPNTNIKNILNNDAKTCYVTEEFKGDHGYILNLGSVKEFYGLRDISSKAELGGIPDDARVYLSEDNITYYDYPCANLPNATGMYNMDKNNNLNIKYKWDSQSKPLKAQFIKIVASKSIDGSTKFQSCEIQLLEQANTFKITYDAETDSDPDYLQSLKETKLYPDTSVDPPLAPATTPRIPTVQETTKPYVSVTTRTPLVTTQETGKDPSKTGSSDKTADNDPDDSNQGDKSNGKSSSLPIIIGVVVGVVVVVAVIVGVVIYLKKRNSTVNNVNEDKSGFMEPETNLEI